MTPAGTAPDRPPERAPDAITLPQGVLRVRFGPGANCSSAGSAVDVLFYGSAIAGALAVALAAALAPKRQEHTSKSRDETQEPPDAG